MYEIHSHRIVVNYVHTSLYTSTEKLHILPREYSVICSGKFWKIFLNIQKKKVIAVVV